MFIVYDDFKFNISSSLYKLTVRNNVGLLKINLSEFKVTSRFWKWVWYVPPQKEIPCDGIDKVFDRVYSSQCITFAYIIVSIIINY